MFDGHDRMSLFWAACDSFRGERDKGVRYLERLAKICALGQIFRGFTLEINLLNKRNALGDTHLSSR